MGNADNENENKKLLDEDYNAWEEIDNMRYSLFLGGWVARRLRGINKSKKQQDREELERKENAESDGREYENPLQLELEDVARKQEEKERLKEARRQRKEARRRG